MKALTVLGTSSNSGKSWLTTALCAWLRRRGIRVAPFKAQNMSNNSYATLDGGEIYKLELDGRIVGKFGRAGKLPKEFGSVNSIDCRSENDLFVAELTNWRVQKVTLRPGK